MLFKSTQSFLPSVLAKKAAPANYVFLDNLLFESEAASAVDCASSCWKRADCVAFTVTATSFGNRCRGHAVVMTSENRKILTATTSLWHRKPCQGTVCQHRGTVNRLTCKCNCTPGFSGDLCEKCPTKDNGAWCSYYSFYPEKACPSYNWYTVQCPIRCGFCPSE
ncbi:hypothetical protein V1264_007899 [Littorina saxatilis]|uniref:EGF-like domain-containing protein n=1 Tax=Littorina saxatilis TaxID=31220 RepID=A0AAN9AXD4_9CAEN